MPLRLAKEITMRIHAHAPGEQGKVRIGPQAGLSTNQLVWLLFSGSGSEPACRRDSQGAACRNFLSRNSSAETFTATVVTGSYLTLDEIILRTFLQGLRG